ncbi:hypothetical protein PQX77_004558 [Marasmius sp. AFHP31]|nr:hypothetical protein PQX77_004558 [Marasmius sp. AFHP31]
MPRFPVELLEAIVRQLQVEDRKTLARCCLANRTLNAVSAPCLYNSIDVDVRLIHTTGVDDLIYYECEILNSAALPHNCRHVRAVIMRGSFSWCANFPHPGVLIHALEQFTNLRSLSCRVAGDLSEEVFSDTITIDTFRRIWEITNDLSGLREFAVRWEHVAHISPALFKQLVKPELHRLTLSLTTVKSIEYLANCFRSTTRMALTTLEIRAFARWDMSHSIPVRFLDVFRQFPPSLCNVRFLRLGILLARLDEVLFQTLSQIPRLEELWLEYQVYNRDFKRPYDPMEFHTIPFSAPTKLKRFTLRYYNYKEPTLAVDKVCSWIKLVISRCPLEEFSFIPFYQMRIRNPLSKPSWDILLDHLTDKHAQTLRRLDLRAAFVRKCSLKRLLQKCLLPVEHLSVGTTQGSIHTFIRHSSQLRFLGRVEFELRTLKRGESFTREQKARDEAAESMLNSAPNLKTVGVNDELWSRTWSLEGGDLKCDVERCEVRERIDEIWA